MKQLSATLWNVQNGLSTEGIEKVQECCKKFRAELIESLIELKSDNKEAIALILASQAFQLDKLE